MNITIRNSFLLSSIILWLSGCTLVPGSDVPYDESEGTSLDSVKIVAITPEYVRNNQPVTNSEIKLNQDLESDIADYDYIVGSGDVLNVTVWGHPELTIPAGSMRSPEDSGNWVHNDGTIFYPYVGKIKVAGLRVTEIRDLIRTRLAEYIEKPQVDVTVAAFRSKRVYITGAVKQPGSLPITNVPLTLIDAINKVGGLAEEADWNSVTLLRDGKEQYFSLKSLLADGDTSQNILLKPKDLVYVNNNELAKVFVLGEVVRPKTYPVGRQEMTLAEALAEAGGINELTADASGVFVFRKSEDPTKLANVYQLDAKNAVSLILADQFKLQPRDVVYVTAAPVTRWNRVVSQILPTLTGLYSAARARDDLRE